MNTSSKDKTCSFYLQNKKRYCKFELYQNSEYCSHHITESDLFMPCQLDPNHKILKGNLDKHLLICPKLKERNKLKEEVWYEENINLPKKLKLHMNNDISNDNDPVKNGNKKYLQDLYHKDRALYLHILNSIPQYFEKAIDMYNNTSEPLIKDFNIPKATKENLLDLNLTTSLAAEQNDKSDTKKNFNQCQALVGILKNFNLLSENDIYVEYGAGKGSLSHHISQEINNKSTHILLELEGRRNKLDKNHRDQGIFLRFRTDITHFNINSIPKVLSNHRSQLAKEETHVNQESEIIPASKQDIPVENEIYNVIGISKHMCGGATDLSLQSLLLCNKPTICSGILIATCCHHRCTWDTYINDEFFELLGINLNHLQAIFHISSWGIYRQDETKSNNTSEESKKDATKEASSKKNHEANEKFDKLAFDISGGLTSEEKRLLGLQIKRILDIGRILYLRKRGFTSYLIKYCEWQDSPENFVILAVK